ncbi:MAG: hypothetical protein KIT79_07875 [Deltaproteobacteria bacterium]|nr:hypothetical protein [Deltaproteobacteria bacterium]
MNRCIQWVPVAMALMAATGCNRADTSFALAGSCLDSVTGRCIEYRVLPALQDGQRTAAHDRLEAECATFGGTYLMDELCTGRAEAQAACIIPEDRRFGGVDFALTRVLLFLGSYESADSFSSETDQCEEDGGEFEISN